MAVLSGTTGNDDYNGTVGVSDRALVAGTQARARFTFNGTNWTVSSEAGNDRLVSVEQVQLNDLLVTMTLGGEFQVNTTVSTSLRPQVAVLSNGSSVFTWQSSTSAGQEVRSQIYNAFGEKVGTEAVVNTTTVGSQGNPMIDALSGGGYAVSWLSSDQDGSGVYVQRFDALGNKVGAETLANTTTTGNQTANSVTGLTNGGFVVTWQSLGSDGLTQDIFAQRFDASGNKLGGETLVNTTTNIDQLDAQVTALTGGGYVVAWRSDTGVPVSPGSSTTLFDIYLQRFDANGVRIGGETLVTTSLDEFQDTFTVTSLSNGGYVIGWTDKTEGGSYFQLFSASGVKIGAETRFNDALNSNSEPSFAPLAAGGFVAVWQGNIPELGGGGVYAQRFSATGATVGEIIPVNYRQVHSLQFPSVDALPGGGFVVTWEVGGAVQAHRFHADGTPVLPSLTGDVLHNVLNAGGSDQFTRIGLYGLQGNDTLIAGLGDDWLDGGLGNDTMTGGNGDDTYVADGGDRIVELETGGIDTVRTVGSYTITSDWVENIQLTGAAGATLIGNSLGNVMFGGAGDDTLNGGLGEDRMYGGRGNDTYVVEDDFIQPEEIDPTQRDLVFEKADEGIDTVVSEISYVLGANLEILRLVGGADLDGTGNSLDNQLTGNGGNNRLDGGAGRDLLVGDAGNDTYVVDAADQIIEEANEGLDTVEARTSWMLGANLENLELIGFGTANATGNELTNYILGNASNNVIDGGEGADVMNGRLGADTYMVDHVDDVASELGFVSGSDLVMSTVTYTLLAEIENLTLIGDAATDGTGNILHNVIRGNSAANVLAGESGIDTLYGGYGNDTLISIDGRDRLYGGVGNDHYIVFGDGDLVVELTSQGTDTVTATVLRAYTLDLNVENLILVGGHVNGTGNALANWITGTAGNNLIDGGAGSDRMIGQGGNDTYVVDSIADIVVELATEGVDHVLSSLNHTLSANVEHLTLTGSAQFNGFGNALANRITGNAARNALLGNEGNDVLIGGGGDDLLYGGAHNDTLNGGVGNDRLDGGTGIDSATYYSVDSGVTVNLTIIGGQNTVAAGVDTLVAIEHVDGSNLGGDTLTGDQFSNRLNGWGGDDTLAGGAGNDFLYGSEGNDTITGDADNDRIDGGNGRDLLTFAAFAGNISVDLNITAMQNTGAGLDQIRNIEDLEGSQTGNDRLIADYQDNVLRGLGGDDVLIGGEGADTLDGGDGIDTADYSTALDAVIADLTIDSTANDGSGDSDVLVSIENLTGSDFDDILTGTSGDNVLIGGGGMDWLLGGAGNDTYGIDNSGDRIIDTGGVDTVRSSINYILAAGLENLELGGAATLGTGNADSNIIRGNALNNILNAAAGNDHLYGGAGLDRLQGGTGLDNHYFDTALGATNVDTIIDFVVADDTIQLSRSIFSGISANGVLAATAFRTGTAALDADDRIVYDQASGRIFYDADGSGVGAAILFAQVTAGTALTNLDFVGYMP